MKSNLALLVALSLVASTRVFAQSQDDKDKPKQNPPRQEDPRRPEQPERDNPPRQQEPKQQEPPEKEKQRQQERDKPPQGRSQDEKQNRTKADPDRQDRNQTQNRNDKPRSNGERQTEQTQNRNQSGRDPQSARRIPDDRFRSSFGRQHRFHVHPEGGVAIQGGVQGRGPRFQYGGYWFEVVEVWPSAWTYDDDCYIDYVNDDYYLYNVMHPGMRILVIVAD